MNKIIIMHLSNQAKEKMFSVALQASVCIPKHKTALVLGNAINDHKIIWVFSFVFKLTQTFHMAR